MDTEAFVRWALDNARSVDERFTVELLVEEALPQWNSRHGRSNWEPLDVIMERQRQRALNPAYDPRYPEESLRRAAEVLAGKTRWSIYIGYHQRPIRDLQALRWLPALEELSLRNIEVSDLGPLTEMPRLRVLELGTGKCQDYRPLARCRQLRELVLSLVAHWPEIDGLETLDQLERLHLSGNLLAFAPGVCWPRVRRGALHCSPLSARSVRALPRFPACEFLSLEGVERLDGIEEMPALRNLTLAGPVRDFAPLAALTNLTCLSYQHGEPRDVAPLVRLPRLGFLSFHSQHACGLDMSKPRDYSPLAEAPALHELRVTGCPPVETEVAAINTGLMPWDATFLAATPRDVPPLRMVIAPWEKHPRRSLHRGPDEPELIDAGLRECEARWAQKFLARTVSDALGCTDWGSTNANGECRAIGVAVESYAVVEKLPAVVEAIRRVLARLRYEYLGSVMVTLKVPEPVLTPAQQELTAQFRREQEDADFERRRQDEREYLDRLHRYELKKQEGSPVTPEEFAPPPPTPLPPPTWEVEEEQAEDAEDTGGSFGDVAVKKKPDPPPDLWDNDHPLADHCRMLATVTLSELWCISHQRDVAVYLMRRQPNLEIPDPPGPAV